MMRLMGAMEIFTAQQQEDIKDEVRFEYNQDANVKHILKHVEKVLKYFETRHRTCLCMMELVSFVNERMCLSTYL